jgi:protein TonB
VATDPQRPSPTPLERARKFIYWAFALSILIHLIFGGLFSNYKAPVYEKQEVTKVSMTKRIRVATPPPTPRPTPTPKPTPPPTPPPPRITPPPKRQKPPPPLPKLKVEIPKTTSKSVPRVKSVEPQYNVKAGSQQGVPQGNVASAKPAPVTTPGPTEAPPRPACAVPNADARTINAATVETPEIAKEQGATGIAEIRVDLSATGKVLGVSVYKSTGNAALDQAALEAARSSTFSPDVVNCVPVAGFYRFHVDFESQ